MPLSAIPGTYRIVGASPDGDSVRFYPDDPNSFTAAGLHVRTNASGGAQLRLDAIDALETHYTPRSAPHPWRRRHCRPVPASNGWVYPTFYSKLYVDLRADLAATSVAARNGKKGVWEHDATLPGLTLKSRTQLQNDLVILPKLFRRLADYLTLDEPSSVNLAGFSAFLGARDDRLFTVPAGQATAFDTLIHRRRQTLTLTLPPEQIVFLEA
jgi:hypothetical protein